MRKTIYGEEETKKYVSRMEEPMRHQIQDAMYLKIPKEYIQILVNKKFNFYSRAYLIGCILDQDSLETIKQLATKESTEEMCLERRKLQEKAFFQESPVFQEYEKMAEAYKDQIERLKSDQQQYQDVLRILNEVTSKREKEEPGETDVQINSGDQKNTALEDENKKLQNYIVQLESDLQEVEKKFVVASEALKAEQKEKEQLQRRLHFMSGITESKGMEHEAANQISRDKKQETEKDSLLFFRVVNAAVCYIKKQKRKKADKDRREFMTDFVKRKSTEPDQVELLMDLYRESWKIEYLKKISECKQIDEMKQMKENIERTKSYQKMLNREFEK